MPRSPVRFAAFALLLCVPLAAKATIMVRVSLERMVAEAEGIALVRVEGMRVESLARGSVETPFTVTRLRVERWFKGSFGGAIEIYERGGAAQRGALQVAGTPEYAVGDRAVVFLERDPLGRFRTYGMSQGRFVVRPSVPGTPVIAEQVLSDVAFASWGPNGHGAMSVTSGGAMRLPLDELTARIADLLAGTLAAPNRPGNVR